MGAYQSMEAALQALKRLCRQEGIEGLAMPCIGCGLDRLAWGKGSAMIRGGPPIRCTWRS